FWLRVSGADASPLGIGRYALILNFGTGPSPVVPSANTATSNGIPIVVTGGWPEQAGVGIVDGHGFDVFDGIGEAAAHPTQDRSVPRPGRVSPGPAQVSDRVAAPLMHSVSDQPSQRSLTVYAVQSVASAVGSGAANELPLLLFDSRVQQPASART